jgi:hypothetical protein
MKKIGMVLGTVLGLLLLAALVIPWVLNVDQYRPSLIALAEKHLNGKLEIGKLSLNLLGTLRVEVAGISLKDQDGNALISVTDTDLWMPWMSVFKGSPEIYFRMRGPKLQLLRNQAGSLNVMTLLKENVTTPGSGAPGSDSDSKASENQTTQSASELPKIALMARFGVLIEQGDFRFKDEKSQAENQLQNFRLDLRDISLTRTTLLTLSADLRSATGDFIKLEGPFLMNLDFTPILEAGKFSRAKVNLLGDFTQTQVKAGNLFQKSSKHTAKVQLQAEISKEVVELTSARLQFFNVDLISKLRVSGLGGAEGSVPQVQGELNSNLIELSPWSELTPMLSDFQLAGSASLEAKISGPTSGVKVDGKFEIKDFTAKAPRLKESPKIQALVRFTANSIERLSMLAQAPENHLLVEGRMKSFLPPDLKLEVTSRGLNLDRLVDLPPLKKSSSEKLTSTSAASSAPVSQQSGSEAAPPVQDFDALLDPLRSQPMAVAMLADMSAKIPLLQIYGVKMTQVELAARLKDLQLTVSQAGLRAFDGTLAMKSQVSMKPKTPTYSFDAKVVGLDLKKAVESQFEFFKNTLYGIANFSLQGEGSSFNPESAKMNLKAQGNLSVTQAQFASMDITKLAFDALNDGLRKASEKLPELKDRKISPPGNRVAGYEKISSDFTIEKGFFTAPNFVAQGKKGESIDLRGSTRVGLRDFSLQATWNLVDTHNFTKARDLSVERAGVRVDRILAESGQPVRYPVEVGCTIAQPCPNTTAVPEHFIRVATQNLAGAVKGRAQTEVKKQVEKVTEKLQEKAPAPVQDAIKKLKGKFF